MLVSTSLCIGSAVFTNPLCVSVIQYAITCGEGNVGSSRVEALRLTRAAAVLLAAYLSEDVVNFERLFNCRSIKEKRKKEREREREKRNNSFFWIVEFPLLNIIM